MRLLYLCEADAGGIAQYAVQQVNALANEGVEVTVLCRPTLEHQLFQCYKVSATLPLRISSSAPKWKRLVRRIKDARSVAYQTTRFAADGNFKQLLIACYAEYFAPFWARIFRSASEKGLRIGTIAHDPIRDFVLGPVWWHRWSVRLAYSFVSEVFVHDRTPVDFAGPLPPKLHTHIIPLGPFNVPMPTLGRDEIRTQYGFSDFDQVFLSFGQIRDGKNLDLVLRATKNLPASFKLLVAGNSAGGSHRRPDAYRKLAHELGIANRCVWDVRYIPDVETGNLFAAADFVLMSYSAKFRSASGVLSAAVVSRKPVLASSGDGPLKTAIQDYHLGRWVPPDDVKSIREGALEILAAPVLPEWERYERENSWEMNAQRVIEAFE